MTKRAYAVVGATGHVGSAVAEGLLRRGHEVRAIGRSAEKLERLAARGAKPFAGEFTSVPMLSEAFVGAAGVFSFLPPGYDHPDLGAHQDHVGEEIAQALRRTGANRVVQLSSLGAQHPSGTGPIVGLHRQEQRLRAIPGLHAVFLRAGYFMENHFFAIPLLRGQGIFGTPLRGDMPIPMVAARDIGAKAAELLDALAFRGQTALEFFGPRAVTLEETARALGRAIGKHDLHYTRFAYDEAEKGMIGTGFPPRNVQLFLEMYRAIDAGKIDPSEAPSPQNTGRTTIEQFATQVFAPAYRAS